jgi:hypothetical protein
LGAGFHSNDARGVVQAARSDRVLPRALGAELGGRHVWAGGSLAVAGWALDLQSELTTWATPAPPSRAAEPAGADLVPLAPTLTSTGGLTVQDLGNFRSGIRYRHVGDRSADETDTVRALGATLAEVFASYRVGGAGLILTVDNLFDVDWNEAQFATTSRLRDEPAAVTELHFTPGSRRSVQLGAEYRF